MTILDEPKYIFNEYLPKHEWNLENIYLYSYEDNSHQFIYNEDQYDDEDFYDIKFKAKIQIKNQNNSLLEFHINGVYIDKPNDSDINETIGFMVKKAEIIYDLDGEEKFKFLLKKYNRNPDREEFYDQDGNIYDLIGSEGIAARFLGEKLSISEKLIEKIKKMQKMINTGK